MPGEDHVLRQRHARHGSVSQTFFRYECGAETTSGRNVVPTAGLTVDHDCIGRVQRTFARDDIEQLGLAVTRNAGNGDNFTASHYQVDGAQRDTEWTISFEIDTA